MRLLLDTHVAIWALTTPQSIGAVGRELIADAANSIHVSAASVWEITIKHALGKGSAPPFSGREAIRYFDEAGYLPLNVTAGHAAAVESLPRLHSDPFDRLLIAQALTEPLHLLTADPQVAAYGCSILRV